MRALVIGGTGFIGSRVVKRLHHLGHEVSVFHRGQHEGDLPADVRHLHGEWLAGLRDAAPLGSSGPDVVLHMRPFGEADARIVTEVFKGRAGRVVAISSIDVYRAYGRFQGTETGEPDPTPLGEDAPLRQRLYPYRQDPPRSPNDPDYWMDDYEKILVERIALGEPSLPGTVLRLPMVYGPGDVQHRFFGYLKRMDDRRGAILLDEGLAQWRATRGYVEDVAAAIVAAVVNERAQGRTYNVGEAQALPEADWVRAIGRVVGWHGDVLTVPRDQLPAQLAWDFDTRQHWAVDTTRIRAELGYAEEASREEALRRTIDWERTHPPESIDPGRFDYASEDTVLGSVRS